MIQLNEHGGIFFTSLGFELHKICDVYWFDGPLCTFFKDEKEQYCFLDWVDVDSDFNRWMLFTFDSEHLDKYLRLEITLLDLIKMNDNVYFIDIDGSAQFKNICKIQTSKIPEDYLPKDKLLFDKNIATIQIIEYGKKLSKEIKRNKLQK